jgi:hypothetical protein
VVYNIVTRVVKRSPKVSLGHPSNHCLLRLVNFKRKLLVSAMRVILLVGYRLLLNSLGEELILMCVLLRFN